MLDQIMVEYDELVSDIQGSGYQTFAHNLQRWLSFLDSSTSLAGILPQLELPVDFNTWYEKCLRTRSSMVGSARLEWPEQTSQQLGLKIRLFRLLGSEKIQPHEFCSNFLYVNGDLNAMVANIIRQLFVPLARELRRYILRETERQQTFSPLIPATDRVVHLNHNSPVYEQTIEAIEKTEKAISTANDTAIYRIKSSALPSFQQRVVCLLQRGFESVPYRLLQVPLSDGLLTNSQGESLANWPRQHGS